MKPTKNFAKVLLIASIAILFIGITAGCGYSFYYQNENPTELDGELILFGAEENEPTYDRTDELYLFRAIYKENDTGGYDYDLWYKRVNGMNDRAFQTTITLKEEDNIVKMMSPVNAFSIFEIPLSQFSIEQEGDWAIYTLTDRYTCYGNGTTTYVLKPGSWFQYLANVQAGNVASE